MEITPKPHLHQDWINYHAFGIVKALQNHGFTTYLVGGCVRDLLLGIHPKDFDIATMAHPPQVRRLIYMSYIIGKRFRLVLVKRDNQQFEVATFRREVDPAEFPEGVPAGDNVFGTPEEDAYRRDFSINGLFYDPVNDQLIDYVNGLSDIDTRLLRMIGDPDVRLREDPIRILRALRLAHKLDFTIDPELRGSMQKNASQLIVSVLPRRREEILKILRLKNPARTILEAYDLGILSYVVPTLHQLLSTPEQKALFLEYFDSYQGLVTDDQQTTQLFARLVFSMLQVWVEQPSSLSAGRSLTLEDEIFQSLMREELGAYKFEQTILMKAIEILPSLRRVDDFKRRGERRQIALMKNEGFALALKFIEVDFQLAAEEIAFWRTAFEKSQLRDIDLNEEGNRRRRPRRRRRNPVAGPRKPDEGSSSSDGAGTKDVGEAGTDFGVKR